ncbi:hypothetical protein QQZ08_005422 [Neonectria magnoliae]|uniref:ATP synthase protein MI25 n=1 Tax=Neonectria magnoliae TaxID=2732573 RepID=A0ABR1I3C8_9HYPO
MDDSPLSITSSITGILTFLAAILAFLYVRYNTLRNSSMEMVTILESVTATVEETQAMSQATPSSPLEDDSQSRLLKKLIAELYSTEIGILNQFMAVHSPGQKLPDPNNPDGSLNETWQQEVIQAAIAATSRRHGKNRQAFNALSTLHSYMSIVNALVSVTSFRPYMYGVLRFVISFGVSRTMMRWYRVRGNVLEMIQQRESIRSRLLFHQISTANSVSRANRAELLELRNAQNEMLASLGQLSGQNVELRNLVLTLVPPETRPVVTEPHE